MADQYGVGSHVLQQVSLHFGRPFDRARDHVDVADPRVIVDDRPASVSYTTAPPQTSTTVTLWSIPARNTYT